MRKVKIIAVTERRRFKMEHNILVQLWCVSAMLGHTLGLTGQSDLTMHRIVGSEHNVDSVGSFQEFKLQKYNRSTQIVKGNFEAFIDLDNSITVSSG
jgi:hypothetical protein